MSKSKSTHISGLVTSDVDLQLESPHQQYLHKPQSSGILSIHEI